MACANKPLFTLTIGEFTELVKEIVNESVAEHLKIVSSPKQEKEEHFNIEELSAFLGCSKVSIHAYKKKGLPYYRIGRKILFKKTEVLQFMKTLTRFKAKMSVVALNYSQAA